MAASEEQTAGVYPEADSPQQPASSGGTATAGTQRAAPPTGNGLAGAAFNQSGSVGGTQPAGAAAGSAAAAAAGEGAPAKGGPPRMQRTAQLFRELRERHGVPSPAWLVVAPLVQVRDRRSPASAPCGGVGCFHKLWSHSGHAAV
jgi:hypothetical protein